MQAFAQRSQISTLEIDRDRAAVMAQVNEAASEAAKYSGGAIKVFIDLRIAILKNTLAMLDQKRASFFRLVALNYTIERPLLTDIECFLAIQPLSQHGFEPIRCFSSERWGRI
jgi:hypothetical protein